MTPKAKVLKKFPRAYSFRWKDGWSIYTPFHGGNQGIGSGATAAKAWADAGKRLKEFAWLKP